jgi:hypothetical protein
MKREAIKQRVEALLLERYPGSRLRWHEDPLLAKPSGTLVWDGFGELPQLARQRQLGDYLRSQLAEDKVLLGVIFTLTREEQRAMQESW